MTGKHFAVMLLAAAVALAGCRAKPPQKVLEHSRTPEIQSAAAGGQTDAVRAAKSLAKDDLAPVKLAKVRIRIPTGTSIGVYQTNPGRCLGGQGIFLKSGRAGVSDTQLYDNFHHVLRGADYNVVEDPSEMFKRDERAEYLVAADITSISVSLCDAYHKWTRRRLGDEGSGSISVNWQVYSAFTRTVVYRASTDGTAVLPRPVSNGKVVLIHRSFREAAENFAADPKFREAVKRGRGALARAGDAVAPLVIPKRRLFGRPFRDNAGRIVPAAVTIDLAKGHGSGFFITRNGLLLTNHHVVGNAKTVRVRLAGGTTVRGKVLRRDETRDVALVKIDADGTRPLPIRTTPVAVGEDVFAIGTPRKPGLAATVTKGIVSAHRQDGIAELPMIQADVGVHGGSSGGALVDRSGNVVGITVSGEVSDRNKSGIGLNFFIPIADALKRLNVRLESPGGRPGA